MNLGLVASKLATDKYKSHEQFAVDVRLVWNNCRAFNTETAEVVLLCNSLSRMFEQLFEELSRVLKRRKHSMKKAIGNIGQTVAADWPSFYMSSKSQLVRVHLDSHKAKQVAKGKHNTVDAVAKVAAASSTDFVQYEAVVKTEPADEPAGTTPAGTSELKAIQPEVKVEPRQEPAAIPHPIPPPSLGRIASNHSNQSPQSSTTPHSVADTPPLSAMSVEQVMHCQHHARTEKLWAVSYTHLTLPTICSV